MALIVLEYFLIGLIPYEESSKFISLFLESSFFWSKTMFTLLVSFSLLSHSTKILLPKNNGRVWGLMVVLEFNASCLECTWFHDEKYYSKTLLILLSLYVLINFFLSIFFFLFPQNFLLINSISFSFVDLLWVSFSLLSFYKQNKNVSFEKKK